MGKSNTAPLNGKQVTVRELTMQEINDLTNRPPDETAVEQIGAMLAVCTNTTPEEIMKSFPSDLDPLVEVLVEVNRPFLDQAAKINAREVAEALEQLLRSVCLIAFTKSSQPDTVKEPGNIPTPIS